MKNLLLQGKRKILTILAIPFAIILLLPFLVPGILGLLIYKKVSNTFWKVGLIGLLAILGLSSAPKYYANLTTSSAPAIQEKTKQAIVEHKTQEITKAPPVTHMPTLIPSPTLLPTTVYTPTPYIQPVKVYTPVPTATREDIYDPTSPPVDNNGGGYGCNCAKTCSQMASCTEAQYQLNACGCSARDADHDGIACDSQCQ